MIQAGSNARGEKITFSKMDEYDALPPELRRALAAAPYSYNPCQVRAAQIKRGLSPAHYAASRMREVFARDMGRRSGILLPSIIRGDVP